MPSLLQIDDLHLSFFQNRTKSPLPALRGVHLNIEEGQIVALAGESGSGKTLTAYSILGLQGENARIVSGNITFQGKDLVGLSEKRYRKIRGNKISMIFQEPMTSLNPVFTVGYQIEEVLITHRNMSRKKARKISEELFEKAGITDGPLRLNQYPFELSGGMRQRAMIAMALATSPSLLIADEPTTALDVTIQAQILNLLKELNERENMAILLITHDLGVVGQIADKLAIMYSGQIMEYGNTDTILKNPLHPYTQGLLNSLPDLKKNKKLTPIPGLPPRLSDLPKGCPFHPRCNQKRDICMENIPLKTVDNVDIRCIL